MRRETEPRAYNVESELLAQHYLSDYTSDDEFEGFASPTIRLMCATDDNVAPDTDNVSQKQAQVSLLHNVKVTKLEDTSESEDNTKTTESGSSDSSSNDSDSDSESQTDADSNKKYESENSQASDLKDEVVVLMEKSSSIMQNSKNMNQQKELSNSSHSDSNSSSLEVIETIGNNGEHLVKSANISSDIEIIPDSECVSSQSVEQLTKSAIGEVVEACTGDILKITDKLTNNVIKKINMQDTKLVSGSSKLNSSSDIKQNRSNSGKYITLSPSKKSNIVVSNIESIHNIRVQTTEQNISAKDTENTDLNATISDIEKAITDDNNEQMITSGEDEPMDDEEIENEKAESGGRCNEDDYYPPMPIQAEVVMSEGSDVEGSTTAAACMSGLLAPMAERHRNHQQSSSLVNGALHSPNMHDTQLKEYLQTYVSIGVTEVLLV